MLIQFSGPVGSEIFGDAPGINLQVNVAYRLASRTDLQFTTYNNINISAPLSVPSGTVFRALGNVDIYRSIFVTSCATDNGDYAHPGVSISAAAVGTKRSRPVPPSQTGFIRLPMCGGGAGRQPGGTNDGDGGGSVAIYAPSHSTLAARSLPLVQAALRRLIPTLSVAVAVVEVLSKYLTRVTIK